MQFGSRAENGEEGQVAKGISGGAGGSCGGLSRPPMRTHTLMMYVNIFIYDTHAHMYMYK